MPPTLGITPDQFTTFGELLKFLRHRAGLSQRELSIAVDYSEGQISRLEHNQRAPDAAVLKARFVPALELEREPEWRERLLELAESHTEAKEQTEENKSQTRHHSLPTQLTSFIGRETELAEITARLNNPDCRLLTLVGAGGIGKTRLALEAASKQLEVFRDGVFFVPLAPIPTGQIEFIVTTIANAVGFTFAGARTQKLQLLDYLHPKQILLLLDNFEHLMEGRELVLEILQDAPYVRVLITSRAPLSVQPEWLLHVSGLSYPLMGASQAEMLASDAAQLFVERARQVNERLMLNAETTDAISRICAVVEGMPLALELAAARVRTLPVSEIATQVSTGLSALQTTMHDVQARHRSLRVVLDWSYKLLSEPERALFRSLSVFVGGWTFDAAVAVAVGETIAAESVPELMDGLVDRSLLVVEQAQDKARYRMLEPVRQYAESKLKESGEEETVRRNHLRFYVAWSDGFWSNWYKYHAKIGTELDNIRAATVWSQRSEIPVEIRLGLSGALGCYCNMRGYLNEARTWLESALSGIEAVNRSRERANATRMLADCLQGLNEYALAESQYLICMSLYQELGQSVDYAWALHRLGLLAREQGDNSTGRVHLEASLALSREIQDQIGTATTLITLGGVFVMLEQCERARELIEEGIAISISLGEVGIDMLAWGLDHLGQVARLAGEFERARQLHEESLPLFRQNGYELGIAFAYHGLGETALGEGEAPLASGRLKRALVLFQKMGDRAGMSWCLAGLAGATVLNGEPERAGWLWGAAEHLRQSIGARHAPAARATRERLMAQAREQLGETEFEAAWKKGEAAPIERVIADVLREDRSQDIA